jgi:TonB family protein
MIKRDISLSESLLIAICILLLLFITVDNTYFRKLKAEIKKLSKKYENNKEIKFTFVDLPEDIERENKNAKLFSDKSRKAAGGYGKKAKSPKSSGNTKEVIIKPPTPKVQKQKQVKPSKNIVKTKPKPKEQTKEKGKTITKDSSSNTQSNINSKKQPKIDVSQLFSVTDPEIYKNKNGGLILPGSFSIDTQGFDLGPYAKEIRRIVKSNWHIPSIARNLYMKGTVKIAFELHKNGTITNIKILKGTKFKPLDKAAFFAISYSNPLPPLPSFVNKEKIGVKWTFYYNEQPED